MIKSLNLKYLELNLLVAHLKHQQVDLEFENLVGFARFFEVSYPFVTPLLVSD